jgi:hypothetical protein
MKATVSVTPTFVLRRLDPDNVNQRYRSGHFSKLTTFPPRLQLRETTIVQAKNVISQQGQGPTDETYTFRDKSNALQSVVTTNHALFSDIQPPYQCMNCNHQFEHDPIGVPLRMKETKEGEGKITQYISDGCHCTFECALSTIRRYYPTSRKHRDPLYMDSESMLRHMFCLLYPDEGQLKAAQDTRLLKPNGPLSYDVWSQKKHRYYRTTSIILNPSKTQYLRC